LETTTTVLLASVASAAAGEDTAARPSARQRLRILLIMATYSPLPSEAAQALEVIFCLQILGLVLIVLGKPDFVVLPLENGLLAVVILLIGIGRGLVEAGP